MRTDYTQAVPGIINTSLDGGNLDFNVDCVRQMLQLAEHKHTQDVFRQKDRYGTTSENIRRARSAYVGMTVMSCADDF